MIGEFTLVEHKYIMLNFHKSGRILFDIAIFSMFGTEFWVVVHMGPHKTHETMFQGNQLSFNCLNEALVCDKSPSVVINNIYLSFLGRKLY